MAVVHVAHVESRAVAVKPAGAERRQLALMREFRDRIGLIHELRQLRRTEKFADDRRNGAHVDEARRRNFIGVLRRHALFDEPLEARDTYAKLVLQKFAHAAHTAVAEVVDIVDRADAVAQVEVGRNRRDDVVHRDVPVIEFIDEGTDDLLLFRRDVDLLPVQDLVELFARLAELDAVLFALFAVFALFLLFVVRLFRLDGKVNGVDAVAKLIGDRFRIRALHCLRNFLRELEIGVIDGRQQPEALGIFIRNRSKIHRVVADHLMAHFARALVGYENVHFVDARILDLKRFLFGDLLPFRREQFARFRVEQIVRGDAAGQPVGDVELFIEFIPADLDHVVAAGIEKEIVQVLAHRIVRRHFAGAEPSVKLDEAVLLALGGILFDSSGDHLVVAENIRNGNVGTEPESAQKDGRTDLSLPVDMYPQNTLRILFEFQPSPAVGDDRRLKHFSARLVLFGFIIRAGRTDELRHDDALRAVDDKGAVIRHEREIAHEYFLIDDFVFDLVDEPHFDAERERVRRVAVPALFLVILGLIAEFMTEKIQFEVIRIVGDRRKVIKNFADALFDERPVRVLLDLDEIGDIDRFVDLAELPSLCLAELLNR